MNTKVLNFILAVLLCVSVVGCSASSVWKELPKPAPSARFMLLEGEYIPLAQYQDKNVMLSFWAAWCSASKSLVKDMNELATKLQNRPVVFLAGSIDRYEDEEKYLSAIKYLKLNKLQHAFSGNEGNDEAFAAFQCVDVPHLFIIDELGNVVSHSRSSSAAKSYLRDRGIMR